MVGKRTSLEIVAYDTDAKAYTFFGISSFGENDHATGTFAGSTWTWLWEGKTAGKPTKVRYVEVQVSPTSYTYKLEQSVAGGPWTVIEEGKATKVK